MGNGISRDTSQAVVSKKMNIHIAKVWPCSWRTGDSPAISRPILQNTSGCLRMLDVWQVRAVSFGENDDLLILTVSYGNKKINQPFIETKIHRRVQQLSTIAVFTGNIMIHDNSSWNCTHKLISLGNDTFGHSFVAYVWVLGMDP